MAERPPELAGIIARYRETLNEMGVRAERVYLFGSYRDGKEREGSDIDLIVVSSDLERLGFIERLRILGRAAGRILEPIEAPGFTPQEVEERRMSSFWRHILDEEAVPM
ncbi:MAG: nucleotidyltransferase domain-containing protein [Planctomycetota bacterium]